MNCHRFEVAVFVFLLSAGVFAQTTETKSFQVAGVARTYITHVPGGLSTHPPLVLNIHGYNIDGSLMRAITRMDKVADREKFIVVYPSALNKSWNMTTGGDDLTFIVAIIDSIDAKYHIDRNRVYATGFSQGGFINFLLGCQYSDVFAAIAPVSGLLPSGTCKLKRPVPMFLKFGTDDVATPASFMASVNSWLKLDSCPTTPVVTRPYPSTNPKSVVTRLYYGPCAQGSEVVVDTVSGGTHDWVLNADTNVNTSEEVWAFLKNFTLNGNTGVTGKASTTAQHEAVSAGYSSGTVRLRGAGENSMVQILDTKGRLVASRVATRSRLAFNGKPGGGVYVVKVNTRNGSVTVRMVIP
jgi:poly(3-hydroxybutyrate) depolymerase